MAFTDRLPQAWKGIKGLIEQVKTKMDKSGGTFTGKVILPPSCETGTDFTVKKHTNGSTFLNIGGTGQDRVGAVYSSDSNSIAIRKDGGSTITLTNNDVSLNKPLIVEGANIKTSLDSKSNIAGAKFTGAVSVPSCYVYDSDDDGATTLRIGTSGVGSYSYLFRNDGSTELRMFADKFTMNKVLMVNNINITDEIDKKVNVEREQRLNIDTTDWSKAGIWTNTADVPQGTRPHNLANNAIGIVNVPTHSGNYVSQIALGTTGNKMWIRGKDVATFGNTWKEVFTEANCSIAKSQNGYCKLANGMIMQWGRQLLPNAWVKINLPIAFTATTYKVIANYLAHGNRTSAGGWVTDTYTTTSFITAGHGGNYQVEWIAVGY